MMHSARISPTADAEEAVPPHDHGRTDDDRAGATVAFQLAQQTLSSAMAESKEGFSEATEKAAEALKEVARAATGEEKPTSLRNFAAVVKAAQKASYLNRKLWRSERSVGYRQSFAWTFNAFIYFLCALLSLSFGVKFGSDSTNEMITVWCIAMFQIYIIIEPIQILIVVLAPQLCDDSTAYGRCCLRARYCYNDFFQP